MEGGMSFSRSSSQPACAACKYQRRKCGSNCILAPFFPQYRQKQFQHCHKLFGIGKISKMIESYDLAHRNIVMDSIIFEADMRAKDPVGGCLKLIQNLHHEIASAEAELQLLLHHLAVFRTQASHSNGPPPPPRSNLYLQEIPLQPQKQPQPRRRV